MGTLSPRFEIVNDPITVDGLMLTNSAQRFQELTHARSRSIVRELLRCDMKIRLWNWLDLFRDHDIPCLDHAAIRAHIRAILLPFNPEVGDGDGCVTYREENGETICEHCFPVESSPGLGIKSINPEDPEELASQIFARVFVQYSCREA